MPAPKELDPTAGPTARFGAELRKYRYAAKLTQEQLAGRIGYSKSRIGNVERGDENPTRELIELCEKALGLEGALLTYWPAISGHRMPDWFRQWPPIERKAESRSAHHLGAAHRAWARADGRVRPRDLRGRASQIPAAGGRTGQRPD
jgi:transcriptional regulator with XRE-family HTH domain